MGTTQSVFALSEYAEIVDTGLPHGQIYRCMIHDLPRRFHALTAERQRIVLETAPPLTGTRWDALLAGVVEHIAKLHGQQAPAWTEEADRFLKVPWIATPIEDNRIRDAAFAPAAFIRHGAIPDPRDLDARGGERHAWAPEP